jgi:hypothetical protein
MKLIILPQENLCGVYITDTQLSFMLCNSHPDKIFIFGDNTERTGTKGQAFIRHCPNSFGIRTKVSPKTNAAAYFSNSDLMMFKYLLAEDMKHIDHLRKKHSIVFHSNGYGNGEAKLPEKAPLCYEHLIKTLNTYCQGEYWCPNQLNKNYPMSSLPSQSSPIQTDQSDTCNTPIDPST